jgi:hypothetical protein
MAVEIKDVEQVAQELQAKFDDFRSKNDKRIEALESEKASSPVKLKPSMGN